MSEPPLIAADTNILLDLARSEDILIDCFAVLRERLPLSAVLIPPTVIHELAELADDGGSTEIRRVANLAFARILKPWGFQPVNCVPVGHGIVHRIAEIIREKGLIPGNEINDSLIVAEAGLLDISILLSSDAHLKEIPHHDLRLIMDAADVRTPLIASPWKIVHEFFH